MTEYDRLYCQLLSYGDNITSHYEENEEVFFFFSRLYHLGQNIGFRSIIIDKSFFDFVAGNVIEQLPPWVPTLLKDGFCFQFSKDVSFPGNLKCLWGFFEQNRIYLGGSSGENQHMSSCEIFTPGETKAEDLLKNLQNIPESDADFTFRFVFTLALLLEAENTPIKKSVKQYKAQRILFGQDFVKTTTRLYLPEDNSIYKVMYLAIKNASTRWTMPIKDWGLAVNQFAILFDGRVPGFN